MSVYEKEVFASQYARDVCIVVSGEKLVGEVFEIQCKLDVVFLYYTIR